MTLVEIMMVVAVVSLLLGGVVLSFRAVGKTALRGSSAKLASAIRYLYDRSVTTGKYYRLVVDLTAGGYRAERSDERFYLSRAKEDAPGRGMAFDADAEQKRRDEEEAEAKARTQGLAAQLQPPPEPPRAKFSSFTDSLLPKVELKSGTRVRDIYTPRQREPYTEGKAFLYFFPDGHTERAVIHLTNADEDVYTLIVHPLSGRVEMKTGDVDIPRGFDDTDEEGQHEAAR